jgi:hypothetical protein
MKGFGFWLCSLTKRLMVAWKVDDGLEDAVLQTPARQLRKEALDGVQP